MAGITGSREKGSGSEALPDRLGRWTVTVVAAAVLLFLTLPILIVVPMSFSSAEALTFPPPGLSLRWYESFFGDARWLQAARTSIIVALASSTLAAVLGSAAAYGLVRGNWLGRKAVEANFLLPLIVPQVITALALYIYFARLGILGTLPGLIMGHTVLGLPYVVLIMSVAIRSFDVRIEQVALSLGSSWQRMFVTVVLPNLAPSLAAAWLFAFVISFDEVIITFFLAGANETIPKRMFNELMLQVNPTITAIATLLIAVSIITISSLAILARRSGLLK
ncbi:ABC transporter permease [Aquibaculum sediminis]|uniref:ABC transporter permease n=1 Tax=Aquibaculum sediminis TaxID=3231907 RepID=UPI0034551F21